MEVAANANENEMHCYGVSVLAMMIPLRQHISIELRAGNTISTIDTAPWKNYNFIFVFMTLHCASFATWSS